MSEETIARAIEYVESGAPAKATKLVRPLLSDAAYRGAALYVLGRCYEHTGSVATASYLLEECISSGAALPDAAERLDACREAMAAQGLTEDFRDAGHTQCPACGLYYRAEYPLCPYCCDVERDPATERFDPEVQTEAEELYPWEDESAMEKLQRAGSEVVEKVKEFAEGDGVREVKERAQELGREAMDKAKEFAQRESVREAAERARKTGEEVLEKTRRALDAEREKFETADATHRRILLVKWAAFLLGGWLVLYLLVTIF